MKHVSQVNIASYRGLSDIEIGGLADVNVFLGPSNSGKTSALEAMYLTLSAGDVGRALINVIRSRGIAGAPSLNSLFPNLDLGTKIDIKLHTIQSGGVGNEFQVLRRGSPDEIRVSVENSTVAITGLNELVTQHGIDLNDCDLLDVEVTTKIGEKGSIYRSQLALNLKEAKAAGQFIRVGAPPADLEKVSFVIPSELTNISVFDNRYSDAYLSETLPSLLDALRSVYPLLKDIRPVKVEGDRWMSYVQLSDGVYPMFAMGDGFKAAMVLLSHALSPGLLLLDTPEAFQHVGGLEVLSKSIAEATGGLGSQVMIATQSLEFLDILLRDCQEREVEVSVTRFEHKDEGIVTYRPISGYDTLEDRRLIGVDPRR